MEALASECFAFRRDPVELAQIRVPVLPVVMMARVSGYMSTGYLIILTEGFLLYESLLLSVSFVIYVI